MAGGADAANRIGQFGFASHTFDVEGQTRTKTEADGTDVYEWDARGRLKKVTLPSGQTVGYGYDALGGRINRAAEGITTNFVYDGQDVVLDRTGSGTVDYLNGFGIDDKLRQTSAGFGARYFLRDYLGSTIAMVSNTGSFERVQYEAFGASVGSSLTRYGFTGRELDTTIGLIHYRMRWYDPQQGRFIIEDPIGVEGGLNLYEYVGGNPVNRVDPQGQSPLTIPIAGAVVLAALLFYCDRQQERTANIKCECPCSRTQVYLLAKITGIGVGKNKVGEVEKLIPCGFECKCSASN